LSGLVAFRKPAALPFFSNKAAAQNKLIVKLNPVLTGWGNYYRHVISKKIFSKPYSRSTTQKMGIQKASQQIEGLVHEKVLQNGWKQALVFQMPGNGKWKEENFHTQIVKRHTHCPSYKSEEGCQSV
jgi:hypothetical protein